MQGQQNRLKNPDLNRRRRCRCRHYDHPHVLVSQDDLSAFYVERPQNSIHHRHEIDVLHFGVCVTHLYPDAHAHPHDCLHLHPFQFLLLPLPLPEHPLRLRLPSAVSSHQLHCHIRIQESLFLLYLRLCLYPLDRPYH